MRAPGHERPLAALAALLVAGALSLATPALGDTGHTIVQRCTLGQSLSGFSQSAYSKALNDLSATTEEYSDCAALIRQAQRAAASGRPAPASGTASTAAPTTIAATPAEQSAIAGAAKSGAAPVSVGGSVVHPGVIHADVASTFSTLPGPLLATLAFVLVCLLVIGGSAIRNRVRDGRSD